MASLAGVGGQFRDAEIFESMSRADPAGLCADADLHRMARQVVADACAPPTVRYPNTDCPGCAGQMRQVFQKRAVHGFVLDVDGLHRVLHIPRRCQKRSCPISGKYVWANFVADKKSHCWQYPHKTLPHVVMTSTRFGVTRRWHEQFTKRILKQYATFWGEAHVHWEKKHGCPSVNRLKLYITKAWFMLRWLERAWERGVRVVELRLSDKTEEILAKDFSAYYVFMRRRRASRGKAVGVRTDLQVIDGHQKWSRRVCSMPRTCKLPHAGLGLLALTGCCDTPGHKSKFCRRHLHPTEIPPAKRVQRARWEANLGAGLIDIVDVWVGPDNVSATKVPASSVEPEALVEYLRALAQVSPPPGARAAQDADVTTPLLDLPDDMTLLDLQELTCTTHKMGAKPIRHSSKPGLVRRSQRSGGFLVAVTSEGYATDAFEFMGSESCSQRYLFLGRLKELYPDLITVIHDDACHLRRFARRWEARGRLGRSLAYPQMRYILDRFHSSGHKDKWCLDNVHPETEENAPIVAGVNTSACEILFHWWARYKHSFRHMSRWTGNFFAQEVLELHNDEHFPSGIAVSGTSALGSPSSSSDSSTASSDGSVSS